MGPIGTSSQQYVGSDKKVQEENEAVTALEIADKVLSETDDAQFLGRAEAKILAEEVKHLTNVVVQIAKDWTRTAPIKPRGRVETTLDTMECVLANGVFNSTYDEMTLAEALAEAEKIIAPRTLHPADPFCVAWMEKHGRKLYKR